MASTSKSMGSIASLGTGIKVCAGSASPNIALTFLVNTSSFGTLQRYYELRDMQIGTNLAMEIIVPGLASWMSLALALKVFASLSTLLLTTGAVMVGRAITGRFSYLLLGVLLFANNAMFQLGLLNYLFGVGVAFWLLSAWIIAGKQAGVRRSIAFSAGCVVVYLCHLSALGIYVIGVVGYELVSHAAGGSPHGAPCSWH